MMLLVFQAGRDRYGIDVSEVVEVIPLVALKAVPHTPDYVAGLINYRGKVVPVIDMTALLTAAPSRKLLSTRIVLVHYADLLGMLVEQATEIIQCDERQFQAGGVASENGDYLGTVLPDARDMIQRICVDKILGDSVKQLLLGRSETP